MSDLDNYSKLLHDDSLRRLSLERQPCRQKGTASVDDIKQERILIAARLMCHYKSRALSLEDIAIATNLSVSDVITVAKENSYL